jgi:peptidoglycan/LPS O-acetylase OafA/YrhL
MHASHEVDPSRGTHGKGEHPYRALLIMAFLSFLSMYILMYAMVDVIGNVYPSLNQFYMAALMTAPMMVIELALMGAMYRNRKWNAVILTASVAAGLIAFLLIRQQAAISDREFLRSMIPHHAGAILMCNQAELQDPQIQELCRGIVAGQQAEIDLMKAKLAELSR